MIRLKNKNANLQHILKVIDKYENKSNILCSIII